MNSRIGNYVTATLCDGSGTRQGVHFANNSDATISVKGEDPEMYICKPTETVIADNNLHGSTERHVKKIRAILTLMQLIHPE